MPINFQSINENTTVSAPVTKTAATYSVSVSDYSLIFNSASTITITLPGASAYPGKTYLLNNINIGTVVSATSNILPRTSATPGTAILAGVAGSWAMLHSDGTNWKIMMGA